MRRVGVFVSLIVVLGLAMVAPGGAASAKNPRSTSARTADARNQLLRTLIQNPHGHSYCETTRSCRDFYDSKEITGHYVGHDEPSVYFVDHTPGSGFDMSYQITLPKDSVTPPAQDGTGGTWNFQLHGWPWFGLTLCDSQSAPEYTTTCVPNSDANAKNSHDPTSKNYLGRHPGNAYMELQFYPPGWIPWYAGSSCTATQYCAALNIDSLSLDQNDRANRQNQDCLRNTFMAGIEPVNLAFVTTDGVSQAPANPVALSNDLALTGLIPDPTKDLLMSPGDRLNVHMFDTPDGFRAEIQDLTSGASGSMTASIANGFGQVMFQPKAKRCHARPYAFHPEYSSAVARGLSWSWPGNVAYADEIGHFEYCGAVSKEGGRCTDPGSQDPAGLDKDDTYCFTGATSTLVDLTGCGGSDYDFDGPSYQNVWPGTSASASLMSDPASFTSPVFGSARTNYQQVNFETDLPDLQSAKTCHLSTGAGCVNPPPGAQFYPFFSSGPSVSGCDWMEGGPAIPGATNTYGGSSTTAFGSLLKVWFPEDAWKAEAIYPIFDRKLDINPCLQT